ncbi:DUF4124 domain-containing protein [Thiocystis violacea]|uniref:DUF4124 domain-containing protein n=1 Tax=Thiocystis violacea TaxID=13725 RepID=UPI0019059B03|nr:DUF4124 domain-containing protein [Thiocystis violacea]
MLSTQGRRHSARSRWLWLSFLLLGIGSDALASESLYRWVDGQGQVNFSDQPPPTSTGPVEVQTLPAVPAAKTPADDRYSVVNQARRMEEERLQREQVRRDAEQRSLEARRQLLAIEAERAKAEAENTTRERYFVHPIPRHPRPPRSPGFEPRPPGPDQGPPRRPERRPQTSLVKPSRP